jgi:hypothetical protein
MERLSHCEPYESFPVKFSGAERRCVFGMVTDAACLMTLETARLLLRDRGVN